MTTLFGVRGLQLNRCRGPRLLKGVALDRSVAVWTGVAKQGPGLLSSPCITRHTGLVGVSRLLPRHRERATIATGVGRVIRRLKHIHSQKENMQP